MRLRRSPWISGAVLSSVALLCHGSGAVNLDGLNPLLAAGCAHQPGSRLVVRNARDEKRSVALKSNHWVRLFLEGGRSSVEGRFLRQVDLVLKPRTPDYPEWGTPADEPVAAPTPRKEPAVAIQLPLGEVRHVPIDDIRAISFKTPRDGWKYVRIGALVGAVPMATIGAFWSQNGFSRMDFGESIVWTTFCAGLGGVPGGAAGGLVYGAARLVPTDRVTMELGFDWKLE